MAIAITIISILTITVVVWVIRKTAALNICPICAGVSLTWLWILLGLWFGKLPTGDYRLIAAMLLGGTVVGSMSKLEQSVKPKFVLIWKTIFTVSGFLAADGLLSGDWLVVAAGIALAAIFTLIFKARKVKIDKSESEQVEKLKNKMKNCC